MTQRMDYEAVTPAGVKALDDVYSYVFQSGLPKALLDLVYLRVSQINGCAYMDMHSRDLLKAGVTCNIWCRRPWVSCSPRSTCLVCHPWSLGGDPFRWVVQLLVMAGRRYTPALDAFVKIARLRNWKADLCAIISDSEASIAVRRRARPAKHRLHTGMHFRRSGFRTIEK
jgi:AhpD family alkylhydroperoxidase